MEDPPRQTDSTRDVGDDTSVEPGGRSKPGRPRWVKVSLIVVIAGAVLVVVLMRTGVFGGGVHGPGQFGPGQHAPGGGASPATP
jgi:hypothetical protein